MIPQALQMYMSGFDGDARPTGSRYICNPPVEGTDEDYVVLAIDPNELVKKLRQHGFVETGDEDEYPEDGIFSTMRFGEINLIITEDEGFFGRFVAATEISRKLNLLNKPDRVALFQAVLYGNVVQLNDALGAAA